MINSQSSRGVLAFAVVAVLLIFLCGISVNKSHRAVLR